MYHKKHHIISVLLGIFAVLNGLFLIAPMVYAADATAIEDSCKITTKEEKAAAIKVVIPIPGVTQKITIANTLPSGVYGLEEPVESFNAVKNMSCYIAGFYRYFAGVAGILAVVMMMWGGYQYVTSFGNQGKIGQAKDTIVSAMLGLAITLGSYLILNFINPNLVSLKIESLDQITTIYQNVHWCNDTAGDTPVVAGSKECGDKGIHMNNGVREECIWAGSCSEGQICFGLSKGYKCQVAETVCTNSASEYCSQVDSVLAVAGIGDNVCTYFFGDTCTYATRITCPRGGWEQVDCNIGGDSINSSCWNGDDNKPKELSTIRGRFCSSGRVGFVSGKGGGAICCGDRADINCRRPSDNNSQGCNSNEIRVDCGQYPPVEGLVNCQADGRTICCQELELIGQ